ARAFTAKLKAHEDPKEKKLDLLESAIRSKERQLAGSTAGAAAQGIVSSHRASAHLGKGGDWERGDWGVGFGDTWADARAKEEALKALKLKKAPEKGDRKYAAYAKEFWDARTRITERLARANLQEMSCLTMMQKPLESYARAAGILSQDHGA